MTWLIIDAIGFGIFMFGMTLLFCGLVRKIKSLGGVR